MDELTWTNRDGIVLPIYKLTNTQLYFLYKLLKRTNIVSKNTTTTKYMGIVGDEIIKRVKNNIVV